MTSLLKVTHNFNNIFEDCQNFFFLSDSFVLIQHLDGKLIKCRMRYIQILCSKLNEFMNQNI